MKHRHSPTRTCLVCGTKAHKNELFRVVRRPDGGASVDETGRSDGRGAYLCSNAPCWYKATHGNRLDHVLKGFVSLQDKLVLEEMGKKISSVQTGR